MRIINVRNVHEALPEALKVLQGCGSRRQSRNGPVIMYPGPVATVYERPDERVLFHPWRDANPFFHFYESLWMLAGRRDIAPLKRFVGRMGQYSDDGKTLNAAYGYRWRHARDPFQEWMGSRDQLPVIIEALRHDSFTRQCVLQIWDHHFDLGTQTKDHACNLMATFQINGYNELDMVVFCRSNDVIWGCYGANAVHFSFLHEYVARASRVAIGSYTQISVNWHAYVDVYEQMLARANDALLYQPYEDDDVDPYPIMRVDYEQWDEDVRNFVTDDGKCPDVVPMRDPFFLDVASPIVLAHDYYKDGQIDQALSIVSNCKATDWRRACTEWLKRRIK